MDQVERFGTEWLLEAWKYVREDKAEFYRMLLNIVPTARTPMDKKSAQNLSSYSKKLDRLVDSFAPWQNARSRAMRLRDKVKPGEVVVILDSEDSPDHPLFAGARTSREK